MASFLSAATGDYWAVRADNPPLAETVGAIEGEAISVQGPMDVDTANGQVKTILRSGSEVHVKSGQAHIDLVEGGNITICGPAHFSVLKSRGSLTIALDNGIIHAHIDGQLILTVYTAQIQAHPIAIGNDPQDVLVGLDASGTLCIRAGKGAVRVEQQLTGQNLLIPQNGDVSLVNGQLESLRTTAGQCNCELQIAAKPAYVSTEISALASTEELKKMATERKPATPAPDSTAPAEKEEPIYQVFMPPLRYDAHAKVQQDYDPKLIVLVRRARVRPTLIFQGKVEGDAVIAQATHLLPSANAQKTNSVKKTADETTWNRVRTFFHKLWSPNS
ncbi:MAG: hypothetical protein WBL63_05625 [Candidatus Acidiferrum sp.]